MHKNVGLNNIWIGENAGNYDKSLKYTIALGKDARPEKDYEFVVRTDKGDFIRHDMGVMDADKMHDKFMNLLVRMEI